MEFLIRHCQSRDLIGHIEGSYQVHIRLQPGSKPAPWTLAKHALLKF